MALCAAYFPTVILHDPDRHNEPIVNLAQLG